MQNKLRSGSEARAWLSEQGLSVAEWCRANGYPHSFSLVRQILAEEKPCKHGMSHQIAVKLGMKRGVITRTPAEARQKGPVNHYKPGAETRPAAAALQAE